MTVEFRCAGHANVRASHHKTLEITSADDVSGRATCVIGVRAELPVRELLGLRGEIEVVLTSGGHTDRFTAHATPFWVGGDELVFRTGPALRQRTFAGDATKAAADLAPELVASIARGEPVDVSLRETGGAGDAGVLFVVSVPIGNLEDLTTRARRVLEAADLVVAEDTRRYRSLARDAGLAVRDLASHHAANEREATPRVVDRLRGGQRVALVSDAGTPTLSDPGYVLVHACWEADVDVCPVPGASALLAALVAAGLPVDGFRFVGFLPRKAGDRRRVLAEVAASPVTTVLYESPNRLAASLRDMADVGGDPVVVVGRELTKVHEQFLRGPASELAARVGDDDLGIGEHTVVVPASGEARDDGATDSEDRMLAALANRGVSSRTLVEVLREATGTPRNEAYDRVLRATGDAGGGD